MKELFDLISKMLKDGQLPAYGELTIKFEAGKPVIAKKVESIKP